MVEAKPELKNVEPFKAVLSGDREAMAKFTMKDLEKILAGHAHRHDGRRVQRRGEAWLATAKDPRFDALYTELTYQPMLEVMQYLRNNGYKTYIVTGGGQDSCASTPSVYGIPPEQVVGTAGGTQFGYDKRRQAGS